MTVMEAPRTGELGLPPAAATPETDAIVAELAGPVWELLRAGEARAALVLLKAKAPAFDRAWRVEYVGLPPAPAPEPAAPVRNCTSLAHTLLSCAQALARGVLPKDATFCAHCTQEQLALQQAPTVDAVEGGVVNVITTADEQQVRRAS